MKRRRGSILPMTLVLLALAAAVLVQACRRNMQASLRLARQQDELQSKWALLSSQATLLPRTGALLLRAEQSGGHPVSSLRYELSLGGQTYDVALADEQAKVNVNALFAATNGPRRVDQAARAAVRNGRLPLGVRLRPLTSPARRASSEKDLAIVFASFGQIFDEGASADDTARPLLQATGDLTCWGGGKLNWRRASGAALEAILPGDAQAVQAIQSLQKAGPEASLAQAFDLLKLPPDRRRALDELLTDSSQCQSLWILGTASHGSATRARLAVRDMQEQGQTRVICFAW